MHIFTSGDWEFHITESAWALLSNDVVIDEMHQSKATNKVNFTTSENEIKATVDVSSVELFEQADTTTTHDLTQLLMSLFLSWLNPVANFLNAIVLIESWLSFNRSSVDVRPDARNNAIGLSFTADWINSSRQNQYIRELLIFHPRRQFIFKLERTIFCWSPSHDEKCQLLLCILENFNWHSQLSSLITWSSQAVIRYTRSNVFRNVIAQFLHSWIVENHEVAGNEAREASAVSWDDEDGIVECGRCVAAWNCLKCHYFFG